ncbi:universal stress protein [Mycolicibacterium sp. XJ2546]
MGTDGSASAHVAVRWAAREAAMHRVPLTVVHALAPFRVAASTALWPFGRVPAEVLESQEDDARNTIAHAVQVAEESLAGADRPDICSELYFGQSVAALVETSTTAKLVVVGRQGQSARSRRMLGSVTTAVVHHAHCPVAVIHDDATPGRKPVLVGIDGSQASALATAVAFDEASRRGADLVALHVWSDADVPDTYRMQWSSLQATAEKTLAESLAGWAERYPDVVVHRVVELDQPARQLLDRSDEAQLVVVGSRGRGGFVGMLLGSASNTVVQAARVPVIVARQQSTRRQ